MRDSRLKLLQAPKWEFLTAAESHVSTNQHLNDTSHRQSHIVCGLDSVLARRQSNGMLTNIVSKLWRSYVGSKLHGPFARWGSESLKGNAQATACTEHPGTFSTTGQFPHRHCYIYATSYQDTVSSRLGLQCLSQKSERECHNII